MNIRNNKEVRETMEITIKNGKTEITINEKAISVSDPEIFITTVSGENSTSVTTTTKNGVICQVL